VAQHTLDISAFRLAFPAFANATLYPNATIELRWGEATVYLGEYDGCLLSGVGLQSALNYLTAHILASFDLIGRGQTPGIVTSSTVDKVSVSLAPPPTKKGWQWWLATTPYGIQLWALLTAKSAGGYYAGGRPERAAFRKVLGQFCP